MHFSRENQFLHTVETTFISVNVTFLLLLFTWQISLKYSLHQQWGNIYTIFEKKVFLPTPPSSFLPLFIHISVFSCCICHLKESSLETLDHIYGLKSVCCNLFRMKLTGKMEIPKLHFSQNIRHWKSFGGSGRVGKKWCFWQRKIDENVTRFVNFL